MIALISSMISTGPIQVEPFELTQVRLLDGPFKHAQDLDHKCLLALDADRFLHNFRINAGLPSNAEPYGGWEAPDWSFRGHAAGHYLSALALMYASTGDEKLKQRMDYFVAELAKCQGASGKTASHFGFLATAPESTYERLENGEGGTGVLYYAMHKWMAGLLDAYQLGHNAQIPKIIGAAREYELTGNETYRRIAEFFWNRVALHRSFIFGGNTDAEHFFPVGEESKHLTQTTGEGCNTYNMLKLTRHIFAWNPSAESMDFYERGLYNHILATQNPETGTFIYFLSLEPGWRKLYGTMDQTFWCCTGSGFENHAKYGDTIYCHDDQSLYVNLFIASELQWREKGVMIRQETRFPDEDRTSLTIHTASPVKLAIKIRYPGWSGPKEERRQADQARVLDEVWACWPLSEAGHHLKAEQSRAVSDDNFLFREAARGGFSWALKAAAGQSMILRVGYVGVESPSFDIFIEGHKTGEERIARTRGEKGRTTTVVKTYDVPAGLSTGKDAVEVRFAGRQDTGTARVIFCELSRVRSSP